MVPAQISRRRLSAPAALAAAAALFAAAADGWFYRAHEISPTFDDAWYLEVSARLYHALINDGLWAFYTLYADAFKFKAPLISVLPLPLYAAFGISLDTALCVNIFALAVLSAYVYLIARRLFNDRAAAVAVVISLTLPMLFGLSRRFFVEYPLTALVTASVYHLLLSENFKNARENRKLGALLGAGLLLKVLYPFYLAGPAADALWQRYRAAGKSFKFFLREMTSPARTILYIAAPIALTWYAHNLIYVTGYIFRASVGDIASHYGDSDVFSPAVIGRYLNVLIGDGPSYYYVLLAAAVAAALTARIGSLKKTLARFFNDQNRRALFFWIAVPLLFTTFGVNKDIRFLTPSLPAFAVLLAGGLERCAARFSMPSLFLAAALLFPLNQYAFQTWGESLLPEMRLGPVHILKAVTNYSGHPGSSSVTDDEKLQRLVDLIHARIGHPSVVVIGTETGAINANNLSFFSARKDYDMRFISYGYAYRRVENTIARLREKDASHILFVDGLPARMISESVKTIDDELRRLVKDGKLPFREAAILPIGPGITAALFERTADIPLIGASARP